MIDLVIPFRSTHDNLELHYCIKSYRKFLNIDRVYIIGPKTLEYATHIPFMEGNHKQTNIIGKIKVACNTPEISDPFICTSDDVFILKTQELKYWHCGPLEGMEAMPMYRRFYKNSIEKGCIFNFDNHAPIIYSKQKFKERVIEGDYLIQSMYCKQEPGEFMERVLINSEMSKAQIYETIDGQFRFSTGQKGVTQAMKQVWKELYD